MINKKLKLIGTGNEDGRNFFVLSKEDSFFALFPMFLLNCEFKKIGIFEDYQEDKPDLNALTNTLQHFKNENYDIDIVYTQDKIILIVRTAIENRKKLVSAIESMTYVE